MDLNKEFTNGEVTILWQPRKCTHAGTCIRLLPNVYQPGRKPWIRPENATAEELIRQVAQCPSGALSIKKKAAETVRTDLEDDGKKGRFVLYAQDTRAGEMTFSWAGDRLFIIDHTEVDEAFGGKGYGGKLVKAGVDYARQRQVKVTPLCPFAKREFEKHADYQDVLFG